MTAVFGAIADDFTGATDLAGLLARSGIRVSLRLGVPQEAPDARDTAPFEVIALKIRTAPVADAIREARAALAWLQAAGAEHFFWKYCSTFDSTAEGNIGPVAEALMDDLGTAQTIYCPAFPENGRAVFMGNLFVGRQLLSESPMKDHPLTPMRDSNLVRLLTPQVTRPVGLIDRLKVAEGPNEVFAALDALEKEGVAHVVIDAVANEDLDTIAKASRRMPLMTGGSAVAMPLPQLYVRDGLLRHGVEMEKPPRLAHDAVVLSGSCSAMTRAQVARYAADAPAFRLDPVTLEREGTAAALAWLEGQPLKSAPLIYATAEPDEVRAAQDALGRQRAGEVVETALAEIAVAARDLGARRFVVAGGETSGAVTQALGVRQMMIGEEIAPGVPWTFAESGGQTVGLALKSGNFGKETFFADALEALDKQ